jgi:membrane protein required for colicin V production
MSGLSIFDWALVLIVLLSVLQAIAQGFFYEFFSLAGVIVGYLLAAWEYPRVAAWYAQHVNSRWAADIAGFFTIFLAVVLLAGVMGRIARWAVHGVGLRWFDRLLGAVFGFVRGAVISTVIVLALAAFAPQWGWLQQSRLAPFLLVSGRALIWAAPADLQQRFRQGWDLLRTVPDMSRCMATELENLKHFYLTGR